MEATLPQQLARSGSGAPPGGGATPSPPAGSPPPGAAPHQQQHHQHQPRPQWAPAPPAGGSYAHAARGGAEVVAGGRGGVGGGSAAVLVQRQREAQVLAMGAHGVDLEGVPHRVSADGSGSPGGEVSSLSGGAHARGHNRSGTLYWRGPGSSARHSGEFAPSSGRLVERLCALALLTLMAVVGLLTFHAPDSALPARYRRDGRGAFDGGAGSGRSKAVYAPGSARRRRGTFEGAETAQYEDGDKCTMAGFVDNYAMSLASTTRPNKYIKSRTAEAEGAMRWMDVLEERTRRAAAVTAAVSGIDDAQRSGGNGKKAARTGDPCNAAKAAARDDSARLRHCEIHGVHIAAHCPALCFEVAAAAIEDAQLMDELMVDVPMVQEALARAQSGVPTCVDFDTARCFQTATTHSCVASEGEEADQWFGVSEMSLMCPRTCMWLLISDSYRFAQSYFDSHHCDQMAQADGTFATVDKNSFYKSMHMEIAHKVHKSGGIDLEFASEQRRLNIGLADGWTVKKDFKSKKAFYEHVDGKVQWDRPEGSEAAISKERFAQFEADARAARVKAVGTMTVHDRILQRLAQGDAATRRASAQQKKATSPPPKSQAKSQAATQQQAKPQPAMTQQQQTAKGK